MTQDTAIADAPPSRRSRRNRQKPRPRVTVIGVLAELLITAGVVILLFVVWQLWIGDLISGARNNAEGSALSQQWAASEPSAPPVVAPDDPDDPEQPAAPVEPVVMPEPADGQEFGVLWVPRFGADYSVPIGGGVSRSRTLDTIGLGHYPGTQMPGEEGNFAVAGHRTTYGGAPLYDIDKLRVGDPIIVETEAGWYVYRFRTMEYVPPTSVDVIAPVPQNVGMPDGERYMTLTSCYPVHTSLARVIAYSVFESFTPRGATPPDALTEAGAS